MPDTTVNYGFRIPKSDGTDYQVPDDIRVPVTQIDTKIKAISDSIGALDANGWITGAMGIASNQFNLAPGWSLIALYYKRQLDIVFFKTALTRTGATITASGGDVPNTTVVTVPTNLRPANLNGVFNTGQSGPVCSGFIGANGDIVVSGFGGNMPNGQVWDFHGCWMM